MKQYTFKEDLILMYIASKAFPDDILDTHQKLHSVIKDTENREYFGISFLDKKRKIQYKAAVSESFKGEASFRGLKTYLLTKGTYNYITIPSDKNEMFRFDNHFKILVLKPKIEFKNESMDMNYKGKAFQCMAKLE